MFSINNVRRFIAFRVFFNCRFYYPIFTILFLDFGLSVAQFAVLNAVWAATIVMAEVPSGALADVVGRRRLLRFAALSMLVEMAILCWAPRGHTTLLFGFFLVNRVLSGLAEAAASGADEAIAYDALQAAGLEGQWGRVLDVQMRLQSMMFIFTMTIGAAVYDPELMTFVAGVFGGQHVFSQAETLRFPLYLTLGLALLTVAAVWPMDEVCPQAAGGGPCRQAAGGSAVTAFRLTFDTGRWILKAPFVLAVICFGMLFDSILRMVVTLASQYYRMVALPESVFGVLGSAMALVGVFIPRLALYIAQRRTPVFCLATTGATALVGLTGMAFFWPYAGLVPALIAFSAMYMTGFYVSYFVNQKVSSARRATVLSFKGLACNLAYGLIGVGYAALLEAEKAGVGLGDGTALSVENIVFKETFFWFPLSLAVGLAVAVMVFRFIIGGSETER
ncbi:MAG: MFS transporter [Desulfobacterales bacterium]|nr:MFS transporter [Desulfobacteraceae bacterium]MDY0313014.1 MFS transporter [Desulfobacterales bacterium]